MAPELMWFLYGPGYVGSSSLFRIYLLIMPIRIISFGSVLLATGNSRYIFIQEFAFLMVYIPLLWLAVQLFGSIGAAWSKVIPFYLVYVPIALWRIRTILHATWREFFDTRYLLKVFSISFLPAAVIYGIFHVFDINNLVKLALGGILYSSSLFALMHYFGLLNIQEFIRSIKERIVARFSTV